ncbi:MAG: threonylcarbamoyl-AMP synthase [Proteobacteria bacterium]|nr:threonylcarbamoyl-AMP synthase [Pseudomonadota bacterium]
MHDDRAAEVCAADATTIARAARYLRDESAVVGFPTETCYGFAVALDATALARLARVKGRAADHALPLIVADHAMLAQLVARLPPLAERLIARYWPGALTLVLPAVSGLPAAVVGPGGGVGVRMSADPVAQQLVRALGAPLTATSANRSGARPAQSAAEAALPGVALVLDDGHRGELPTTLIELLDTPRILRQGRCVVDLDSA